MRLTVKLTPYNLAYLVYPVVYVCSIPLTLLLKQYNGVIAHVFPVNFVELYIVSNHGYVWFSALYWALAVTLGYFPGADKEVLTRYTKIYLVNTLWILVLLEWCFGSPIFERISVFAGAACSIEGIVREYECKNSGGVWSDPFDSSSHYTFLISSSLLVWYLLVSHVSWITDYLSSRVPDLEVGIAYTPLENELTQASSRYKTVRFAVEVVAVVLLVIWFISYVTTSIFFHTIPEKFVGLICGLFVPTLIEYI
ncbi:FIT family protein YFT2 [Candida viswanathii]|uniref:FIT family protein YFT2 n=1 Tax=Candida viswanathii TaxID=5486 RepID=A0A367YC15_9ASCO|nr:FIT family protein YFT2 [Candida viswanathii]